MISPSGKTIVVIAEESTGIAPVLSNTNLNTDESAPAYPAA